jgi:hypothetical protein
MKSAEIMYFTKLDYVQNLHFPVHKISPTHKYLVHEAWGVEVGKMWTLGEVGTGIRTGEGWIVCEV